MADHLDQLSNDDLPPEAVERQACLQNFSQQRLDLIQNIDPQQRANFLLDNAGSAPLHFETVTSLGELSESDASVLLEYDVFSENDVVSQLNITYEDLPASVLALVPNELGGMPPVMVIGSENMDLPSIGMHVEPSNDGPLYYKDANGIITDVTVDNRGVILLNVSNNNKSLLRLPSDRVEEIIFNEYGHRITEEVREQFELAYAQQLVGTLFRCPL